MSDGNPYKMPIVKTATVEVIPYSELNVGDVILWSNFSMKVVKLEPPHSAYIELDGSAADQTEAIGTHAVKYSCYYRIREKVISYE